MNAEISETRMNAEISETYERWDLGNYNSVNAVISETIKLEIFQMKIP